MMNISIATTTDLETIAQALAEGEHDLGVECPWFVPGPSAPGIEIASFDGFDVETF
jgi:hypothetical protein